MTFALISSSQAGELRFRFQPGDKFSLVSVTEQKASRAAPISDPESRDTSRSEPAKMGAAANEESMEQTSRLECDFDVEEVDQDGCAWAKYTYKRVALRAKGAGVDMDYDSDANRPKVPPQVLPLHLARGESFFVKITPQGRIDKINGLSAVVGNAKSKIPNFADKGQLIQLVERYFDEAAIKRGLESQFAVFPDAGALPIDIGCTWNRQEQKDENRVALQWSWRFSQRRGTAPDVKAIIDVNLIVSPTPESQLARVEGPPNEEQEVTIGGVRTRREVQGQGTGQIEVDEATGRIISSTLTQDLVEKVTLLPEGPVRRTPPTPSPICTHVVTAFQMIKRDSGMPPASPEPNRPALSKVGGP
jgi:hypothetical protein